MTTHARNWPRCPIRMRNLPRRWRDRHRFWPSPIPTMPRCPPIPSIEFRYGFSIIGTAGREAYVAGKVQGARYAILPLPPLMQAAHGMGEVHAGDPDADGVIRRVPLVGAVGDKLYPTLAGDALRVGVGGQTAQVKVTPDGFIDRMRIGEAIVPVNDRGELLLYDTGLGAGALCFARRSVRRRFRCRAHRRPPCPDRYHGRRVEGQPRDAVGAGHAGRRDPRADPRADHRQRTISRAHTMPTRSSRYYLGGLWRRAAVASFIGAVRSPALPSWSVRWS